MTSLRIGTDCSGIEAPIHALRQLQIPHRHVWSSDIDKYVIQSIKANYKPEILFGDPNGPYPDGDITKRDNTILPDIDLYVAGFPCQPFSLAGRHKGFKDKRGNVFWECLDVIKLKKPKYFILENVKGILWNDKGDKKDKYGRTWIIIWSALKELEKDGYIVKWKTLNTRHYGIPQNRERVFMVGKFGCDFQWPEPTDMDDLIDYIDWTHNKKRNVPNYGKLLVASSSCNSLILNLGFTQNSHTNTSKICPCILAMSANKLWNKMASRYCNVVELLMLQGFDTLVRVVSVTQLKKQIGNSMSVNVVIAILNELL